MRDLVMFKHEENLKEGEYTAWILEGPSSEEHISDPSNLGKTLFALKKIDLLNDVTYWSPGWLKNRAKELLQQNDSK